MQKTDEFIINRLMWKAEKYKLPTKFAFYFKDIPPDLQEHLNNLIDKKASGIPVLFFTQSSKEWTLVCTKQVICNDNEKIFELNFGYIKSFLPTVFEEYPGKKNSIRTARKEEWDTLTVDDYEGRRLTFHANKGSDLFALWNILLMVSRLYNE